MDKELKKELPPKYYLDNFASVISFVEKMYGNLLSKEEQHFIDSFRSLTEDAQCMFLRFVNRKGLFFRTDRLVYPEISNIQTAIDELLFRQFIELPAAQHQALAREYFSIFGKGELAQLYKKLKPEVKGLSRFKKPELVQFIIDGCCWHKVLKEAAAFGSVIKHKYVQELELIKFLFFGHLGGDMVEFVIRDLGMVRYETPEEDKLVALFKSRQEIEDRMAVCQAYDHFRILREQDNPEDLYSWYMEWSAGQALFGAQNQPLFNRITLKLARILERHKQFHWALEVYGRTQQAPARERRARLLQKTGSMEEALALCQQMAQNPQNAEELFFARDFENLLRKKKKSKSTTLHLREADCVQISQEYRNQVEKGVIHYYLEKGQEVMYSENYLWRGLFGLVFWDIIYDQEAPVFHSPLQKAPSDLYLPDFLPQRREQMEERLAALNSCESLLAYIQKVYDLKWGISNPLVSWHENTLPLVSAACRSIKPFHLKEVLLEMAKNLKENGRGFPDLFSWTKKGYMFIEVKSPNDTLSAQQLFWLQFFQETGIAAKVLKVEWGDGIKN